jgi:hypothetical protein
MDYNREARMVEGAFGFSGHGNAHSGGILYAFRITGFA